MKVDLEESEWSQVISIIASQHPLIAKISSQLIAQRRANGASEGIGIRADTRADTPREPAEIASADRGDSPQLRTPRSPTKRPTSQES